MFKFMFSRLNFAVLVLGVVSLFLAVLTVKTANAEDFIIKTNDPKLYADNIGNKIIEIIESKKTDDQKEKDLVQLFRQNVDTDWMGKFVMGKFFKTASTDLQRKYLALYQDYVVYSYIPRFREYSGEKMNVKQAVEQSKGEYLVKTTLKTKKAKSGEVLVDYKVKKVGTSFKIFDIIGEGVSLITTQRSDFSAPLSKIGVEEFVKKLEAKVKQLKLKKTKS